MKLYIIGEIVYKNKNNIILESRGDGYLINICDENRYEVGQKAKIYIFDYKNDYSQTTYGFKEFKERLLFLDLISIEKIGPKIAMIALEKGWEYIARLISNSDTKELSNIQFINERLANIICVQLSDRWAKIFTNVDNKKAQRAQLRDELNRTLIELGFKKKQVELALRNVKINSSLDEMVEESIKIIASEEHELSRIEA